MDNKEGIQETRIPFYKKEALFNFEVKSALSNFLTDIMRPAARVLGWGEIFKEQQEAYDEQITREFLKAIEQR
jgi:hypothetical protein